MSVLNSMLNVVNKSIQKMAAAGDTRGINEATKMVESSSEVAARLDTVRKVNNEWKEEGIDTEQVIHRSPSEDLNIDNIRTRAGTTPAADGKGPGVFGTPVAYADETKAFGKNEYIVTTDAKDSSKIGLGNMELGAGSKSIPEAFVPEGSLQGVTKVPKVAREQSDQALRGLVRFDEKGMPGVKFGPNMKAQRAAGNYMQTKGFEYRPPVEYKKIDPRFATDVAKAFEKMKHQPDAPEVKEAYGMLIQETMDQYNGLVKAGVKMEFTKPGQANPYPNPRMMTEDVNNNNHMWIFPTDEGFGAGAKYPGNPLLEDSGVVLNGQPAKNNDIFRAVHDYYGHVKEGVGFRGDGEENAFLSHSSMFSPKAQRALATETRGQNSWLNWGPEGKTNRSAVSENTTYADQKIGLLPRKFTDVDRSVHLPTGKTFKPAGEVIVEDIVKFINNFKLSLSSMRSSNKIKGLFANKELTDEDVAGMAIDVLRVVEKNSAGKHTLLDGVKTYERVSMQDLYDKIGRRIEARLMKEGDKPMTERARRELGAVMLEYARGNFKRFISEEIVPTKKSSKKYITTNATFSEWSKGGGKVFMKAFDNVQEARQPSTVKSHGEWKADTQGNIVEAPEGSDVTNFLAGGSKTYLSESGLANTIKSLNILGAMKTGVNETIFKIWRNLNKKGYFDADLGPDFKPSIAKSRLTQAETDELSEGYQVVNDLVETRFKGKGTGSDFKRVQDEVFTPRLRSLEVIRKETATLQDQRTSKLMQNRSIDDEISRRLEDNEDGGVFTQYTVDSRGRGYPVDGSGANINTGGVIRHAFTGETKPITDDGFNQILDELVLVDSSAKLSKMEATGLERKAHYLKNKDTYLKQGNDAIDNADNPDWNPSWLKGRKDAGPYLNSVIEIARIKRAADKGLTHESNMMIEIDAPNSGSQHIGAQYGDESILWQTSVLSEPVGINRILNADEIAALKAGVPDDSVARDLYTEVGTIYERNVEKGLKDLEATDPQKAQAFRDFSSQYLKGGRGVTKPIVMKVPYGAGDASLRVDMVNQLSGRQRLAIADFGIDPEDLMNFHWDSMRGALDEGLATQMEFKKFNSALGKIYKKATNRKPFKVTGPDGGVTDLTRYTMESVRGEVLGINKGIPDIEGRSRIQVYETLGVRVPEEDAASGVRGYKVDNEALSKGLAPNVTHSMDAAFLHRLVVAAKEQDINLRVVHDAFFAHPNDIAAVKELAGKVFQDMHVGYDFRAEMVKGLSEATGESIESITNNLRKQGINLDIDFDLGSVPPEQLGNIIRGG